MKVQKSFFVSMLAMDIGYCGSRFCTPLFHTIQNPFYPSFHTVLYAMFLPCGYSIFLHKNRHASIVPDIDKADTWGTIHQWADINAVARSIQDKCGSLDASGYISKKLLST